MDWSKVTAIVCALSVAALVLMLSLPESVPGKAAAVSGGLALLYLGSRVAARGRSQIPGKEPDNVQASKFAHQSSVRRGVSPDDSREMPLDNELVTRIQENLKSDPSEQLREMLAQSSSGRWSPEAQHAARLLLDRRLTKVDPEPVYRTIPRDEQDQSSRVREAVARGFSRDLLSLDVGSRVYCRWRGESGTIISWDDENERFFVRLDNGEWERANLGMFE